MPSGALASPSTFFVSDSGGLTLDAGAQYAHSLLSSLVSSPLNTVVWLGSGGRFPVPLQLQSAQAQQAAASAQGALTAALNNQLNLSGLTGQFSPYGWSGAPPALLHALPSSTTSATSSAPSNGTSTSAVASSTPPDSGSDLSSGPPSGTA
jgi:hypothetical protein